MQFITQVTKHVHSLMEPHAHIATSETLEAEVNDTLQEVVHSRVGGVGPENVDDVLPQDEDSEESAAC